ncbi:hypothetical protein MHEL_13610 [Mycolicibacterium helvum]|uniref:DUF732 domain-containing protein n=1 Tax=Mycolicibacterium helvum TaxID=1534349 RepID=A0A7I7T217_9MYCO|nr:hypothetical protein MHEL_13610 [Mycolicibacterium helvum]
MDLAGHPVVTGQLVSPVMAGLARALVTVVAAGLALASPAAALPSPKPEPPHIPFTKDIRVAHTMAPPPPAPTFMLNDFDRYFIAKMQSHGWVVVNVATFVSNARSVCGMFRDGADAAFVNSRLVNEVGMNMGDALMFSSTAMLTYPDCP